MSFLEDPPFPSCPSFGFISEPMYLVTAVSTISGYERRNRHWARPLHRYIVNVRRHMRELAELLEFWHSVGGSAYGFRFKDYVDYKSCRPNEDYTAIDAPLVLVSETTYQLTKSYVAGVLTQYRDILKPVQGTILVAEDGVLLDEGTDYTIDYATGLVTLSFTPTGVLTWGGEFDVPVHFSSEMPIEILTKNVHEASFTMQEIRNPIGIATSPVDNDDDDIVVEDPDSDDDGPNPPDSDTDPGQDSGTDTIFFWDFESEPVGDAEEIDGIWRHMVNGDTAFAFRDILSTPALVSGENFYRATLIKNGTTTFRAKRALDYYFGTPEYSDETGASDVGIAMTPLGGGHHVAVEDYWFGFKIRIDRIDDGIDGIFVQWHTWQGAAPTFSPQISLRARGGVSPRICVHIKKNTDGGTFLVPLFEGADVIGESHKYVFQLRWDSRAAAAGSIGLYRVWVDDESSPRLNWVNRSTNVPGDEFVPWFSFGWYKPEYKRTGVNGDTNIMSFSHLKIMGGDGSRLEVLPP